MLSFPISELLYFTSTGEWIDLFSQEGQIKFLAFSVSAREGSGGGLRTRHPSGCAHTADDDDDVLVVLRRRVGAPSVVSLPSTALC